MTDLQKAMKKHEDAVNNQKSALRSSLDPNDHAKATVASQAAANASSEAHTAEMRKRFEQTNKQNQGMTGKNYKTSPDEGTASLNPFKNWSNIRKAMGGR